ALCLVAIPFLGAAPLAAILTAMTTAAPADPARAGAIAGFTAGAIAAVFYGMHCVDDSPLFVATWYTLAIGAMAIAGAAIGRRVLA
ncbi:NrsF family protein, partial [Escherichia coli]|uniref:NrsF family protein n=1 Tax=Escherichia coli TaxID=562 RepID=UPI0013D1AB5B